MLPCTLDALQSPLHDNLESRNLKTPQPCHLRPARTQPQSKPHHHTEASRPLLRWCTSDSQHTRPYLDRPAPKVYCESVQDTDRKSMIYSPNLTTDNSTPLIFTRTAQHQSYSNQKHQQIFPASPCQHFTAGSVDFAGSTDSIDNSERVSDGLSPTSGPHRAIT